MAVLRNAILCLEDQGLPVHKSSIQCVLDKYYECQDTVFEAKHMLRFKDLLCESAREVVEKEIQKHQEQFDLKQIMEEMEQQTFTEFGLHNNKF